MLIKVSSIISDMHSIFVFNFFDQAVLSGHMEITVASNVHATRKNRSRAIQSMARVSVKLDGMVLTVT